MKKMILFSIILFFIACEYVPIDYNLWIFDCNYKVIDASCLNKEKILNIRDWVCKKIKYKKEAGFNFWKTPRETLKEGCGDCKDTSLLVIAIAYKYYNIEMDLVDYPEGKHILTSYRGVYYETTNRVHTYTRKKRGYTHFQFQDIPNYVYLKRNRS